MNRKREKFTQKHFSYQSTRYSFNHWVKASQKNSNYVSDFLIWTFSFLNILIVNEAIPHTTYHISRTIHAEWNSAFCFWVILMGIHSSVERYILPTITTSNQYRNGHSCGWTHSLWFTISNRKIVEHSIG